jgi:histidine ammonia-lyase
MLCVQRCLKLFTPALSGLPLQLTLHGPEHSGFATLQKTLVAVYGVIRHLANPASLDGLPVSEMVEDHASMAPHVVAKAGAMAPHLCTLAAIELLAAAQAVDLRGLAGGALGTGAARAHAAIRGQVPMLDVDRPQGPDVETICTMIAGGTLPLADLLAP